MLLTPSLHPFHMRRPAKIVAVLRLLLPSALRLRLARFAAWLLGAEALPLPCVLRRNEELLAAPALTLKRQRGHLQPYPPPALRPAPPKEKQSVEKVRK